MKRWLAMAVKNWLAGYAATVIALGALAGCQPTFMTKEMYQDAHVPHLKDFENNHNIVLTPVTNTTLPPSTVTDADRPQRYMTLQEAVAVALENGHANGRGGGGGGFPGQFLRVDDTMVSATGGSLNAQSERIRVLALNPAITGAAMEAAMARFDPVWVTKMEWSSADQIRGLQNLGSSINSAGSFLGSGNGGGFQTGLVKALPTGGVAELSFLTNYRQLAFPESRGALGLDPVYTSRVSIGFEQPLWKDWGIEINQLLARFPGIQGLNSNALSGYLNHQNGVSAFVDRQSEGILISRLRFDQQRAEFERHVTNLMVNTEVAYWNLYNTYGALYAFEENLRIMHKAWQDNYSKFKAGALPPEGYYQVLGQYQEFRGERLRALNAVLDAERQLRGIIGLPVEDGTRLVPITPPTVAELKPDWKTSLEDALNLRPELQIARDNVRYHQYLLSIQKNNMKPDLRAFARAEPFGQGSTLTGSGTFLDQNGVAQPANAFRSLTNGHLMDWQIGVNLNIPLGYRAEMAAVRAARLELTQAFLLLRDQEDKATRILAANFAELSHWYERIKVHRMERLGYLDSLKTRIDQFKLGKGTIGDPPFLEAQRRYASALVKEYEAIATYNSMLARLEWSKGTILRYNNVHISEGALPESAQVRAVDREKERGQSMILRDRPDSLYHPGRLVGKDAVPSSLEAPLPLEEAAEQTRQRVVPAKHESKWKFTPQPVRPVPIDEKGAPWANDEKPLEFKPASAPKAQPILAPAPLPKIESTPIAPMKPITIGALPARPSVGVNQVGASGFVTMEGPTVIASSVGPEPRNALPSSTLAPSVIRASIGSPQVLEFTPTARK